MLLKRGVVKEGARRKDGSTAPAAGMRTGPFAAVLGAAALALAFLIYFPTLGSSWAYDDIDYINHAADAMAGKRGFLDLLLRPQGEHIVAGFRLVLHACLKLFGIAALPMRLCALAAHAASALFLGLVARRYSGCAVAGLATGLTYVGACGFSSMWVWYPSGASVPFAMALLTGGLAALAHRERLGGGRRARLLAGVSLVAALLTESTLAPLAALPLLLDELERRRAGARGPVGLFSVFCIAAAAAVAVLVTVLYARTFGPRLSVSLFEGIPRAVFLLLAAPFRLFFPGVSILAAGPGMRSAVLGSLVGIVIASSVAALLAALWRRGVPRLAWIAALLAVGPVGVVGLVGLGRWQTTYIELYRADRYFFTLLVPISLLAGAVAFTVAGRLRSWPRHSRAALLLCVAAGLGAELVLHRQAAIGPIPFGIYQAHEDRFEQLQALAVRLRETARALPPGSPPLEIPDTSIWLPEVHNGHITTRTLLHVFAGGPGPRLRLGGPTVSERDARLLNPVLEEWAREIGEPLPYLSVQDGRLVNAHQVSSVDFRTGPQDQVVVRGFYGWEEGFRWMGRRGELRLAMTCQNLVFQLGTIGRAVQGGSGPGPLEVRVTAVDEALGSTAPLGTIRVEQGEPKSYHLDAAAFLSRLGIGRRVRLVLESDRTFRPADLLSGSADSPEVSVQVFFAGCV